MSAVHRAGIVALAILGGQWHAAAAANTVATKATAASTLVASGQPSRAVGDDAAAMLAYDLDGRSSLAAERRYLDLPSRVTTVRCRGGFVCSVRSMRVPIKRTDVLAGRVTRLTLIWSAGQKGLSEQEVVLAANGERHVDWLRPSARGGGGRRVVLDLPALAVRRAKGLAITITVAVPAHREPLVHQTIDGLELELLP